MFKLNKEKNTLHEAFGYKTNGEMMQALINNSYSYSDETFAYVLFNTMRETNEHTAGMLYLIVGGTLGADFDDPVELIEMLVNSIQGDARKKAMQTLVNKKLTEVFHNIFADGLK